MHNRLPCPLNLRHVTLASAITLASLCNGAAADTPLGWISADNYGAYTLDFLDVELQVGGFAMNDDLKFMGNREDIQYLGNRLEGEDRDIAGSVVDLQFGLTSYLTAFYRFQASELSVDFSAQPPIGMIDGDDELQTESSSYGLKWNIYEAGRNSRRWTATSLELSFSESSSDDFSSRYDSALSHGGYSIFGSDATFTLQDMDDEAWKLRLIHTVPMGSSAAGTLWAGYSQTEANAALSVSAINLLAPLQDFTTETEQYTVGASLNWNITPRMPLQLTYEYINVADREDSMIADPLQNAYLPDFLQAGNVAAVDEDENHIITASLSYWITPHINVGFTGKLFSNQFVGVTPHYHNPLTAAFEEESYSYAGLHLGIKI